MAEQYPTQDIAGQIVGVVPGFTRNNKQKFDIQFVHTTGQQETLTTFRPEVASKVNAFIGQTVTIRISINGQYRNFEDVLGVGAALAQPVAGAAFPAAVAPAVAAGGAAGFVDDKQREMRRVGGVQNATSVLGAVVASTDFYFTADGSALDLDKLAADIISLAGKLTKYTVEGPSTLTGATESVSQPQAEVHLDAAQIAALAASQGLDVKVGTAAVETAEPAAY